jgi:ankyrin repeat protein
MFAAGRGHREVVELLLKNGANVNAKAADGWTALVRAADRGHRKVVEVLLKNGADVNAKDIPEEFTGGVAARMLAAIIAKAKDTNVWLLFTAFMDTGGIDISHVGCIEGAP